MNVHDSERLSGSLEAAGYVPADGAEPDIVVINTCAVRENADNKLYGNLGHLAGVKRRHAGHADRRRRLPRPEGQERHPREGALGRRRLRHPQHGLAAEPARARPPQRRGAARDPRVARGVPVDAADQARLDLQRLGVDLGRLQQHLHLLHRARAARQGEGPPPRRDPRRDPGARRRRRHRGHPARPERQLLRRRVRRPAGVRQAAARRRRRSTGSSASASPARTPRPSPTTSSTRWPRRPTVMPQLHMPLQSGSDRILKAMRRSYRSEKFLGILDRVRAQHPERGDLAPTSSSASPARPRRTSRRRCASSRPARFASAFTFQYSIRPGTPGGDHGRPGAEGGRAGALRAPRSRCRSASRGRRTSSSSAARSRCSSPTGEGKQGRRDAPPQRPRRRQPARALRGPRRLRAAAARRRRHGDDHAGGAVPPDRRLARRRAAAHPPHPRGRRVGSRRRPRAARVPAARRHPAPAASRSACRRCAPAAPSRSSPPASAPCRSTTRATRSADATLIAIVGATGTGKSDLALDLAEALARVGRAAEVVNADAMQLYRGMDIGTAKLPLDERRGVPHHLLDVLDVTEEAIVARVPARCPRRDRRHPRPRRRRRSSSAAPASTSRRVIHDFRFPGTDAAVRARLEAELAERGPGLLHARLPRDRPRDRRERSTPQNGRRIVRALEVDRAHRRAVRRRACPTSPCRGARTASCTCAATARELVERLDARVARMWRDGLARRGARPRRRAASSAA